MFDGHETRPFVVMRSPGTRGSQWCCFTRRCVVSRIGRKSVIGVVLKTVQLQLNERVEGSGSGTDIGSRAPNSSLPVIHVVYVWQEEKEEE